MKRIIIVFITLFLIQNINSQSLSHKGTLPLKSFSSEEYNGHNQVWCAVQDNSGKMFFGHSHGLTLYDGTNWENISIPNLCVRSLNKTEDGKIMVGGIAEFGLLEPDSIGTLKYKSLVSKLDEKNKSFNDIWSTKTIKNTTYFFSFNKLFIHKNNKIKTIEANFKPYFGFKAHNKVFAVLKESEICLIENDSLYKLPGITNEFDNSGLIFVLPFDSNKLLIITNKSGIWKYNMDNLPTNPALYSKLKETGNLLEKFESEITGFLQTNGLYTVSTINDTLYALGTNQGGAIFMNANGKLHHLINTNRGLPSNSVLGFYPDQSDNLWILLGEGISYTDVNSPITIFNEKKGLGANVQRIKIFNDIPYVASTRGLFYLPPHELQVNNDENNFKYLSNENEYCWNFCISNNNLFTICEGKLAYINGNQLIKFDSIAALYSVTNSLLFSNCVFYIFNETLNVASYKTLPNNDIKITSYYKIAELGTMLRHMVSDTNGNLWITGQYGGVFFVNFNNGIDKPGIFRVDPNNELKAGKSSEIFIIDNKIIASSGNGAFEIIRKSDSIFEIIPYNKYGNFETNIEILKTTNNKVFIAEENNVFQINNKNNIITYNYKPFKIINTGINEIIEEDNLIWVCSDKGLYRYNPEIEKDYNKPFNTLIRKVYINTDSLIFNGEFYSLKNDIKAIVNKQNKIPILKYKANSLLFTFSSTYFEQNEKNLFSYKLEGFDNTWSKWTKEVKKEYTNLHEGEYCFKVKSKNIYENESSPAAFSFEIKPPWSRTVAAYIGYLVILIFAFYFIIKAYSQQLINAKKRLEKIVTERTNEILIQNKEIQQLNEEIQAQTEELLSVNNQLIELNQFKEGMMGMIVHDLKNPLNTILGLTKKTEIKQAGQQMLNMVLNILDVQKFEKAEFKLQISDYYLCELANKSIHQVKLLFERKSINLKNLIPKELIISADFEIINRVFVNILTNAIKFTPNNGIIIIQAKASENNDFVKINIQDSGSGIHEEMLPKIFDKFSQAEARKSGKMQSSGLGLAFCKLAIESHGGKIGVESKLGKGSNFWFEIQSSDKKTLSTNKNDTKSNAPNLLEKEVKLNYKERVFLAPFKNSFKKYSVYEYSDLVNILSSIKVDEYSAINIWKKQLENAIRACNEEKFKHLIN